MHVETDKTSPLSIAHSVVTSLEINRLAQQHFDIGQVTGGYLLRRGFNDVYLVQCADHSRWLARLSAIRARGPTNIDYEASMLTRLASRGACVAEAIRSRAGGAGLMVSLPEGSRCLALFRFLDGEPPETLDDMALTGAGLARLHTDSEHYKGPLSLYKFDTDSLLKAPLSWLMAAPTLDSDLCDRFNTLAAALEADFAQLDELSWVACHGDCHGGNNFIRVTGNGRSEAVFFDFDDTAPGYLAYDLAVFLWSQLVQGAFSAPNENVSEKWARYLAGYQSEREIAQTDMAAIPVFVRMRHFLWLGELASRRHHWGSEALPRLWLRKQADLLENWRAL